ncbi:MAG: M57 family metalloprotease [Bacteroidota bacterium]
MNNKFFGKALVAGALLSISFSCSQDDVVSSADINPITTEVIDQIKSVGFNPYGVSIFQKTETLSPEEDQVYLKIEDDILITMDQLAEMAGSEVHHVGAVQEQYRTNNLVSSPRTISVIGYTGGSNALDNTMRTALQWSVNNFNRLNIGLNFTLSFATSTNADMVVYRVSGPGGGSAGFPSGGLPNKFIQIQSGTSSFGTNVTEHVITHEMGHSVGLRHTDYFNRSLSCGTGGNEGDGGVGAILIPGTPSGFDPNSIMLSCFGDDEDGEFGNFDIVALEFLY